MDWKADILGEIAKVLGGGTMAVIFWEGAAPDGIEWPTFTLEGIREEMKRFYWTDPEPLDE